VTGVARDLARASALVDVRRYEQAVSLLARIVAAEPDDSRAWCLLATAHLGTGQYQEAAAAASRAVTLAPSDDWPHRLTSAAHRHLGKANAAVRAAHEACKMAPEEWRSYLCLAQALLATEVDFDAAERAAATALRLAPGEPDAHFVAGTISAERHKWAAARAHQERALALNPAHDGALNELGRIRFYRGGQVRAVRHFIQAAQSAPGVSGYGWNVEVVVRRIMSLTIKAAYVGSLALLGLTLTTRVPRGMVVIGYAVIVLLSAGYAALQLRRMPPGARRLLRTRRMTRALSAVNGSLLIALITVAVTPARALSGALLAATGLIFATAFIARAILHRKKTSTIRQTPPRDHAA
jgi:tetratricopeptide (TPR) repeat protein